MHKSDRYHVYRHGGAMASDQLRHTLEIQHRHRHNYVYGRYDCQGWHCNSFILILSELCILQGSFSLKRFRFSFCCQKLLGLRQIEFCILQSFFKNIFILSFFSPFLSFFFHTFLTKTKKRKWRKT